MLPCPAGMHCLPSTAHASPPTCVTCLPVPAQASACISVPHLPSGLYLPPPPSPGQHSSPAKRSPSPSFCLYYHYTVLHIPAPAPSACPSLCANMGHDILIAAVWVGLCLCLLLCCMPCCAAFAVTRTPPWRAFFARRHGCMLYLRRALLPQRAPYRQAQTLLYALPAKKPGRDTMCRRASCSHSPLCTIPPAAPLLHCLVSMQAACLCSLPIYFHHMPCAFPANMFLVCCCRNIACPPATRRRWVQLLALA